MNSRGFMYIISFLSQKGGSGKTTLAVHTAVAAYQSGERVVVIDTDPQKSASTWGEARTTEMPIVATVAVSNIEKVIKAARDEKMTLVIIDTAPHSSPDAVQIANKADLVVIPCRPTAFDIAAAGNAVDIVKAADAKSVFVLSACPFRSPEIKETRVILEKEYGLPVAPTCIVDRRAFARAIASGRAVTEFDSECKAADEIRSLWKWLRKICER